MKAFLFALLQIFFFSYLGIGQNSTAFEYHECKCQYDETKIVEISGPSDLCDKDQIKIVPSFNGNLLEGGQWFRNGVYISDGGTLVVSQSGTYNYRLDDPLNGCYIQGEKTIGNTTSNFEVLYEATQFCGKYNIRIFNNQGWLTTIRNSAGTDLIKLESLPYFPNVDGGIYTVLFQKNNAVCSYSLEIDIPVTSDPNSIIAETQYLCGPSITLSSEKEYTHYSWKLNGTQGEIGTTRELVATLAGTYILQAYDDGQCHNLSEIEIYDTQEDAIRSFFEERSFFPTRIMIDDIATKTDGSRRSGSLINLYDGEMIYHYETPTNLETAVERMSNEFALFEDHEYELILSNNAHFCEEDNYEVLYEGFKEQSNKIKIWFHIFDSEQEQDFLYAQIKFPDSENPLPFDEDDISQLESDKSEFEYVPTSSTYDNADEGLFMTQMVHITLLKANVAGEKTYESEFSCYNNKFALSPSGVPIPFQANREFNFHIKQEVRENFLSGVVAGFNVYNSNVNRWQKYGAASLGDAGTPSYKFAGYFHKEDHLKYFEGAFPTPMQVWLLEPLFDDSSDSYVRTRYANYTPLHSDDGFVGDGVIIQDVPSNSSTAVEEIGEQDVISTDIPQVTIDELNDPSVAALLKFGATYNESYIECIITLNGSPATVVIYPDPLEPEEFLYYKFNDQICAWVSFIPEKKEEMDVIVAILLTSKDIFTSHGTWDGLSAIPVIGTPIDVINTIWYLAEGEYVEAAFAASGLIFDIVTVAKLGTKWVLKLSVPNNPSVYGVLAGKTLDNIAVIGKNIVTSSGSRTITKQDWYAVNQVLETISPNADEALILVNKFWNESDEFLSMIVDAPHLVKAWDKVKHSLDAGIAAKATDVPFLQKFDDIVQNNNLGLDADGLQAVLNAAAVKGQKWDFPENILDAVKRASDGNISGMVVTHKKFPTPSNGNSSYVLEQAKIYQQGPGFDNAGNVVKGSGDANLSFEVGGRSFDNVAPDGKLIDRKYGHGNSIFDRVEGEFGEVVLEASNPTRIRSLLRQAKGQISAANGHPIRWEIQSSTGADGIGQLFNGQLGDFLNEAEFVGIDFSVIEVVHVSF